MGVHGLWRLIEPSGKPVPVETLENKVLAVDVSIWIHQAIKGFQDSKGAPTPNAHLLGIFHRVCKLLYFRIKPIFVFDGGVPQLKKQTIAKRNQLKSRNVSEADKLQKQLLDTLVKHSAVSKVLAEKAKAVLNTPLNIPKAKEDDLFILPKPELESGNNSDEDDSKKDSPSKNWNLHNIDTKSAYFKSLPVDVRHEILTDLKETRKQSSWGYLHEMPTQSDDFSGFQMKRLLKRQEVQSALEETQKEMGGHSLSLGELEEIMKDQGIIEKNALGRKLASDENTKYLFISDIKKAIQNAKKKETAENLNPILEENEEDEDISESPKNPPKIADQEFEDDLKLAIALSLGEQPSTSESKNITDENEAAPINYVFETDSEDEELPLLTKNLTAAQNYMTEYSGLSRNEIARIISSNQSVKKANLANFRKTPEVLENTPPEKVSISVDSSSTEIKNSIENTNTQLNIENIAVDKLNAINENQNSQKENSKSQSEILQNEPFVVQESIISSSHESQQNLRNSKQNQEDNEYMSCSDSDDFEEVPLIDSNSFEESGVDNENKEKLLEKKPKETLPLTEENKKIEIVIKTDCKEEDDLFADIFDIEKPQVTKIKNDNTIEKGICQKSEVENINFTETDFKINSTVKMIEITEVKENDIETKMIEQAITKKHFEKEINISEESDAKQAEKKKLSDQELLEVKESLDKVQSDLRNEMGLRERLGTNITDQMYKEAQELLELFGLPYVVAPMEAEAQCAFLELISLTDGTITDDSDIWLFGGKTVYKNFFDQNKYVLEFKVEDIKHHFKLSREQMILLALLVGSDYTTGLVGVGPVTALEILAAFPPSNISTFTISHSELLIGLNEFKKWFKEGKTYARSKNSLRNKLKNVTFSDNFPSVEVVSAYLNPEVDTSEEKFSWSKPDFETLEEYARTKFGWTKVKVDSILKPVMKKVKETKYQATIRNYFQIKHKLSAEEALNHMSKRVKSAVENMGKDPKDIDNELEEKQTEIKSKKRSIKENKDGDKPNPSSKKRNKKEPSDKIDGTKTDLKVDNETGKTEEKEILPNPKDSKTTPAEKQSSKGKNNKKDKNEQLIVEVKLSEKNKKEPNSSKKESKSGRKRKISNSEETKDNAKKGKKINRRIEQSTSEYAEELQFLASIESTSKIRVEEIKSEAEQKLEQEMKRNQLIKRKLHTKPIIYQKLRDKDDSLKAKLRAIEIFRKSKQGPGYIPKGEKKLNAPKDDAELSESSSDSDL